MMRLIGAICVLALLGIAPALAKESVTIYTTRYAVPANEGVGVRVDWAANTLLVTTQIVTSVSSNGEAGLPAMRAAALQQARREAAPALAALRLTVYATLGEAVTAHYLPAETIPDMLRALLPVVDRWDAGRRTLVATYALPLVGPHSPGAAAARMLADEQRHTRPENTLPLHGKALMLLHKHPPLQQRFDAPYTGIILDCTGLRYTPVLLPKLISLKGVELWGAAGITPRAVQEKGVAGYATNIKAAIAGKLAGATPLLLRPVGTAGPLQGSLVLRDEDAQMLQKQQAESGLAAKLPVIIIID